MMPTTRASSPGVEARSYAELLAQYQPRPIRSEAEAEELEALMNAVMDSGELSADERDFLVLLGALLALWEGQDDEWPDVPAHRVVKALLEARGLPQQADRERVERERRG